MAAHGLQVQALNQSSRKVELRALVPNPNALSYFLVSYNPQSSRIQMQYITNEATHKLWEGGIGDVSVGPAAKGGNVNIVGGPEQFCPVQMGQRDWSHFALLAKTSTFLHQALQSTSTAELRNDERKDKYSKYLSSKVPTAVHKWKNYGVEQRADIIKLMCSLMNPVADRSAFQPGKTKQELRLANIAPRSEVRFR
jgi:hypothetical protein